jgi:hypothetical protein
MAGAEYDGLSGDESLLKIIYGDKWARVGMDGSLVHAENPT